MTPKFNESYLKHVNERREDIGEGPIDSVDVFSDLVREMSRGIESRVASLKQFAGDFISSPIEKDFFLAIAFVVIREGQCLCAYDGNGNMWEWDGVEPKAGFDWTIECQHKLDCDDPVIVPDFIIRCSSLVSPKTRLTVQCVVECDGHDFHEKTKEQAAKDKKRDRIIIGEGYDFVLRYTGSEIYNDPFACALDTFYLLDARLIESYDTWDKGAKQARGRPQ